MEIAEPIYEGVGEPSYKNYYGRCHSCWSHQAKERRIRLVKYLLQDEWERWHAPGVWLVPGSSTSLCPWPPLPVCCTSSRNLLVLDFFFWVSIFREGEGMGSLHYLAVAHPPPPPRHAGAVIWWFCLSSYGKGSVHDHIQFVPGFEIWAYGQVTSWSSPRSITGHAPRATPLVKEEL